MAFQNSRRPVTGLAKASRARDARCRRFPGRVPLSQGRDALPLQLLPLFFRLPHAPPLAAEPQQGPPLERLAAVGDDVGQHLGARPHDRRAVPLLGLPRDRPPVPGVLVPAGRPGAAAPLLDEAHPAPVPGGGDPDRVLPLLLDRPHGMVLPDIPRDAPEAVPPDPLHGGEREARGAGPLLDAGALSGRRYEDDQEDLPRAGHRASPRQGRRRSHQAGAVPQDPDGVGRAHQGPRRVRQEHREPGAQRDGAAVLRVPGDDGVLAAPLAHRLERRRRHARPAQGRAALARHARGGRRPPVDRADHGRRGQGASQAVLRTRGH
mmetsp:Transcript_497/g.1083  ORF Transcript_497/g.1083 Transcript_497/m.1083 type:complete len:321 (+) Transcript_497:282-1244(+)